MKNSDEIKEINATINNYIYVDKSVKIGDKKTNLKKVIFLRGYRDQKFEDNSIHIEIKIKLKKQVEH